MVKIKLVPPDGGYGWIITGACGLYYFITLPIVQGQFGLLFKETFSDLEFSAASISLVMNTNAAFQMFVGIMVAPLLKRLGYRKVSLMAAVLITTGVYLTAYANSFAQYIFTFGIVTAIGYGMGVQAYTLAQNAYFIKNRTRSMGYSLTICALGPVIMPQIITILMTAYGVRGAIVIMASISANTVVSALLLQPLKWHTKEEIIEDEIDVESDNLLEGIQEGSPSVSSLRKCNVPQKTIQGFMETHQFEYSQDNASPDIPSNKILFQEKSNTMDRSLLKRIGKRIVDVLDLTLLKDLTFVNIIIGMSFAVFAELNFSLLTPFIMRDFGLTTQETATFMSVISAADICIRFITPYLDDFFSKIVRVMYLWSLVLLILSRFSLLLTNNYYGLLVSAAFLGISKGFRTIYWSLVLPDSIPIERLAAASGLQSTVNSFLIWIGGPFLGFVRDVTGSYKNCIFVVNFVTFLTIISWNVEFAYKRYQARRQLEQK